MKCLILGSVVLSPCNALFLRAGGSVFTLKEMLGNKDLAMAIRQVTLAQADMKNQHRQFSPVQALK